MRKRPDLDAAARAYKDLNRLALQRVAPDIPTNYLLAGLVLASLPMVAAFLLFQRQILAGLTAGYAAMALSVGGGAVSSGEQLCQHHCPVAHVAAEFPVLCEAETAVISRLVGTHVQRLATIAHGDGICTTHIPSQTTRRGGNRTALPDPVLAGSTAAATAGASTRSTPSIDRERTPA